MAKHSHIHHPVQESHPRHVLAPSHPSPVFLAFVRAAAPLYLRFALKFQDIRIQDPSHLLHVFQQFQNKETRLLFAFRHPYGDEPQLLQHVFDILVPRLAKKAGHPLPHRPHVRFVHGYDVAFWGGPLIRFVLPRSGAVPIQHLQADPAGMKRIRELLLHDVCPLALAPEGQISYRSGSVPRLEPGAARIGFWCAKDLEKAGRPEQALLLPVSVHYQYREKDAHKLNRFLNKLEAFCGLPKEAGSLTASARTVDETSATSFRQAVRVRLLRLEDALLALAEAHYGVDSADSVEARRDAIIEAALTTGERMLGLDKPVEKGLSGSPEEKLDARIVRVYRIRKEGWDRIYPIRTEQGTQMRDGPRRAPEPQSPRIQADAPLPMALRHRKAGEGWYAMRHMEVVDILEYLDAAYLDTEGNSEGPSFDRLCETAINLQDLAWRLAGGNITTRANPLMKTALILIGEPINLSERLPAYRENRNGAVREVTNTLREEYLKLIHTYERRRNG